MAQHHVCEKCLQEFWTHGKWNNLCPHCGHDHTPEKCRSCWLMDDTCLLKQLMGHHFGPLSCRLEIEDVRAIKQCVDGKGRLRLEETE